MNLPGINPDQANVSPVFAAAQSTPLQGLCTDTYTIKVCAGNQSQADLYTRESHGVIVKANCKKALTILCG